MNGMYVHVLYVCTYVLVCVVCACSLLSQVYLHLGVHGGARQIRLETRAYNDVSFRSPDERGYQPPMRTPIDESKPSVATLDTRIAVQGVCAQDGLSQWTTPSLDPGRFLCNYIYYRSLAATTNEHEESEEEEEEAIFVHVPPFRVQPLAQQVQLLSHIMHYITESLLVAAEAR